MTLGMYLSASGWPYLWEWAIEIKLQKWILVQLILISCWKLFLSLPPESYNEDALLMMHSHTKIYFPEWKNWKIHDHLLKYKIVEDQFKNYYSEAATSGVLLKKLFIKILQDSQQKCLCWTLFLIKLQACRPTTLSKRDHNTGVSLWLLQHF